jgi:glycerol-3-phosphate acyltransferase PlsY
MAENLLQGRASLGTYTISMVTLASVLAAAAAVLGHVRSIYLRLLQGRWRGGRGVATALGAVLVVNPWISLVALAVALPTIFVSRYVSLGSILGAVAGGITIILLVALGQMDVLSLLFVFLSVFIIVAHRDNIERLLNGTERKIGERAKV